MYSRLLRAFGPQDWWPGDSPFEVAVGAILTQNTNWQNVERAIANLKSARALSVKRLHGMDPAELAGLIRPAGYFNVKAVRLKSFVHYLVARHGGSMARMSRKPWGPLREELLEVHGVGAETADSILLYALEKPVFVIDAYTKRILSRHGVMDSTSGYDVFQDMFLAAFPPMGGKAARLVPLFNEYHALMVKLGKDYCRPRHPACGDCPLDGMKA